MTRLNRFRSEPARASYIAVPARSELRAAYIRYRCDEPPIVLAWSAHTLPGEPVGSIWGGQWKEVRAARTRMYREIYGD